MSAGGGKPVLIGIDWGSSNLRVALLDAQGALLARRESAAGAFTVLDGDFARALWPLCGDWLAAQRLPLLACGMIGSRQGLADVPYLDCPAGTAELAQALYRATLQLPSGAAEVMHIVPGLRCGSAAAGWDVMRGEETQIVGLPASAGALCLLPGTHAKWLWRGTDGRIEDFQTYMTGELFELLSRQGSLSRLMAPPQWSPEAFAQGVGEARDGVLPDLLFRVRSAGLMGDIADYALADYLSGLLIGAEIRAGLARFSAAGGQSSIPVLGSASLTRRYAMALAAFGLDASELPGDAVFGGLLAVARTAGLLAGAAPDPEPHR